MDTVEMKIGNIIESKETSYRIIGYRNGIVSLCQMETGKLKIYLLSVETVMDYIQKATMGTIGRLYSNSLLNYLK